MENSASLLRGLGPAQRREIALSLLKTAIVAVDPKVAVLRHVRLQDSTLHVGDRQYNLHQYDRIFVVGAGKATAPMAQAIESVIGSRITAGIVNVKYGYTAATEIIEVNEAGHPIPDEASVRGARKMAALLESATERDLIICLISGGGSALMVLPPEGITLADKRRLTDALLRCGANINEMNTVRKHLSLIKGGGLARLACPATLVSLILSDVVATPLDVIASGPTVPDTSNFADAYAILERYEVLERIPKPILDYLQAGLRGAVPDNPKEGDRIFEKTYNLVVGSNEIASRAALEDAKQRGFNTLLVSTYVEGEAREVAKVFAAIAKEIVHSGNPIPRPACVVAGGETTVSIRGQGLGGRNQEFTLAAAVKIDGMEDTIIVGSATDGSDGPTDAAGAIADGTTVARARALGLDPLQYLADNDSYHFFGRLGDLITTGPTNTNVNDLIFVLVF